MRDIQADWNHWSPVERLLATLLMTLAGLGAATLCYLQL
jgi:hypothetical protein